MNDRIIESRADLEDVLSEVTFRKSCVDFGWAWETIEVWNKDTTLRGWLVNTTFRRPDIETGEVAVGRGRQEFIAVGASESGVVKTCWLLAELIVRHELMEAFEYRGVRIFDPHHSIFDLAEASASKEAREHPRVVDPEAKDIPIFARRSRCRTE